MKIDASYRKCGVKGCKALFTIEAEITVDDLRIANTFFQFDPPLRVKTFVCETHLDTMEVMR